LYRMQYRMRVLIASRKAREIIHCQNQQEPRPLLDGALTCLLQVTINVGFNVAWFRFRQDANVQVGRLHAAVAEFRERLQLALIDVIGALSEENRLSRLVRFSNFSS
jgi:hypothetical protein